MKIKFFLFFFGILLFAGCGSTPKHPNYFPEISKTKVNVEFKELGYTLEVPNTWYAYLLPNRYLMNFSPKELKSSEKDYYHFCYIFPDIETKEYKSLDAFMDYYIRFNTESRKHFDYKLLSETHTDYGKYNLLIYKTEWHSLSIKNIDAIYFHNNKVYIIKFKALEKYFDLYLEEAMKIITSFKIIN